MLLGRVQSGCGRLRQDGLHSLHVAPEPFLILQVRLDLALVFEIERNGAVNSKERTGHQKGPRNLFR